jgi:hypothetical protein
VVVQSQKAFANETGGIPPARLVSAAGWSTAYRRKGSGVQVFATSMADIKKALQVKVHTDPWKKLPAHYHDYLLTFDQQEAETLPPLRGSGIDHAIELEKGPDRREPELPWGPLYNMSRDELLVLRKTLTGYLDKGFI